MDLIYRNFFLSALIFTYSNVSNSQLLHYNGLLLARRMPNQTDSDVSCSRSWKNHKKGLKDSQG